MDLFIGPFDDARKTGDNGEILVKDLTGVEETPTQWYEIGETFDLTSLPSEFFNSF